MTTLVAIVVGILIVGFLLPVVAVGAMAIVFLTGILSLPFVWLWECFKSNTEKS